MMERAPKIAVAVSRFNEHVTERLLESCLAELERHGVKRSDVEIMRVPGGYELPWAAQRLARTGGRDAVIALGCILKGETSQNDHISRATILHLQSIGLDTGVPVILGVITPDSEEQALARTKGELDRGRESALAALEMARLSAAAKTPSRRTR